ncbi:MAG: ABC transporter permease [Rhodothermaceae bacterium]|nr:ABC transporter permease [Rhodothermaceae bacterium]
MIFNYLKMAFRTIRRQGVNAVVNILGLALGIAAAFVIGMYMRQELTYEKGFDNNERIYRVATDFYSLGGFAKSQKQLVDALPEAIPAIELATRFDARGEPVPVWVGQTQYEEASYMEVDSAFFDMFSFEFIEGDRKHAMHRPGEVVISDALAKRYFGDESAIGKTIRIGNGEEVMQISGIVRAPSFKTHLQVDLWLPLAPVERTESGWTNANYYNYFRLKAGHDAHSLVGGLDRLLENTIYPASGVEMPFEQWRHSSQAVQFWVQPLTDIYLYSKFNLEFTPGGNPTQVYVLGLIGFFLLLIAGFNYVNLTTAASASREKEIGVKRSMGVERGKLISQFLMESVALSLIAMIVATGLAEVLLSFFEYITGTVLAVNIITDYKYLLALLAFSVLIGLLAGVYPALYLSRIRPVQLLKGGGSGSVHSRGRVRHVLVVAQFAIAIILIAGSAGVRNQLTFMRDVDKGLDEEGVLVIENLEELGDKGRLFKERLGQLPAIASTSIARRIPTGRSLSVGIYRTPEMSEGISLERFRADEDYMETLGMHLLEGRNFTGTWATDSASVILNESAVRALGIQENPIGQRINQDLYVIGVISDFNYQSLRTSIEPVIMQYADSGFRMAVNLNGTGITRVIKDIEATWAEFGSEEPVSYYFLDESFTALIQQEESLERAISLFTWLAILIACMGLFGLTMYTIRRRTKEIGIRKILGATVVQIVALLSSEFLRLVGIAFLVALPVSYFTMQSWLNSYAYRIDLGPGIFLTAGLLAVSLAVITLAYHAVKASLTNPAETLHYE